MKFGLFGKIGARLAARVRQGEAPRHGEPERQSEADQLTAADYHRTGADHRPADARRTENAQREADSARMAALERLCGDLRLFLRMKALDVLREEDGGFAMELGGDTLRMPGVHTLFEAYLAVEAHFCGDWHAADEALCGLWAEAMPRMVLEPQVYRPLWEGLRRRVAEETAALAPRYDAAGAPDRQSLKNFTCLCMHICGRMTGMLSGRRANIQG